MAESEVVSAKLYLRVGVYLLATMLLSLSMGMNAIVFPVKMEELGFAESLMGIVLSGEIVGAILVCLLLQGALKFVNLPVLLVGALCLRVMSLYFITSSELVIQWMGFVLLHGVGAYSMIIILQTIVTCLGFSKRQTMINAFYGVMISIGYALGPPAVEYSYLIALPDWEFLGSDTSRLTQGLWLSAAVSAAAGLLLILGGAKLHQDESASTHNLLVVIKRAPGVYGAIANSGVVIFGIMAFITIYGIRNGMEVYQASLLLTAFTAGCIVLEPVYAWISSYFDLRYFLFANVFLSLLLSIFLPLVIYEYYQVLILLFLWGGSNASCYSVSLTLLSERFEKEEMIAANSALSLVDSVGGTLGVLAIGFAMQYMSSEGLPYVIIAASVIYFSYALTRYRMD